MLVLLLVVVLIILSVMFGGFQKGTKSGGLGPLGLSTEHHAPLLSRRPLLWTATRGKQGVSIHDHGIPGSGRAAHGRKNGLWSLWQRLHQIIRRGCPIHAVPATWMPHPRRIRGAGAGRWAEPLVTEMLRGSRSTKGESQVALRR